MTSSAALAEAPPVAEPVTGPQAVPAPDLEPGYLDARGRMVSRLSDARDPELRADLLLDLARLEIGQALAPEALSFLSGLPETLDAERALRRDRIALAAWGVAGGTDPAPQAVRSLLSTDVDWPERAAWRALSFAREGEIRAAANVLPEAGPALDAMAPALAAAILPELLEAAIEGGLWDTAHGLAQRFDTHAELRNSPAYRFLLGRAAQAGGNPVMAFDSYAMAAGGGDAWAQRARLALVDLGRATGALAPEDAAELLRQSWRTWRGDALEVATLERLAEVEHGRGETEAAIAALTEIQRRHPGSDAAQQSEARLDELVAGLYARGGRGALPIAEFVAAHRRLSPDLMFRPGFVVHAEKLAARLLEIGATDAAAREYAALRDQLAVMEDLGLEEVTPARRDALRLAQAEALLRGGQTEAAAQALGTAPASAPELRDRLALLQARLSSAEGDGEGVIAVRMEAPTEGYRRLRAAALFERGDWEAARDAYVALWREKGAGLGEAGTIRLLLAAHRAGDAELVAELLERLPDLARTPELAEVARSLAPVAPLALPIGQKSATDRMQGADAALRRIETAAGDG
ncbi:hypothetical protein T8T21_01900 [Limimaricola variabilis]|uniref:hypothetical protein n=1 Tax=Limimaricola variabilis TaxID=1492771 RepID=UPI002AC90FBB|nr:hypothetical protein [Limimaricola variabilis]WPY94906.1 hypothetical protein T8T21_01900 [Limimaricola variabilis]